jgi:hypothetical protein
MSSKSLKSKDGDGRASASGSDAVLWTAMPGHDDQCIANPPSQRSRTEGIAGLHRTLLVAGHEPLFSLRGGTMGE